MNKVLYLFCLTSASDLSITDDELLSNVDPLFIHPFREFNAVLSWVSAKDYQDQVTDNNSMNSELLMQRVFFHERVVEKIMRHAAVFPISFGTLFSSIASLEEQILIREAFFSSCLTEVYQKEEYAVRVYLNQDKAVESLMSKALQEKESSWTSCSLGVQYLKKQRLHNEIQSTLNHYLSHLFDEVLGIFQRHASNFKNRGNTPQSSDTHGTSVMHWAFLIPRTESSQFNEQINLMNTQYNRLGVHFTLTGPWPAYSFCVLQS